jgi:hypothetical protein
VKPTAADHFSPLLACASVTENASEQDKSWWLKHYQTYKIFHKLLMSFSYRPEAKWARTCIEGILQSQNKVMEILKVERYEIYRMLAPEIPCHQIDNYCSICKAEERSIACLPCAHVCYCESCVNRHEELQTSDCPTCRAKVEKLLKVYL